MRYLIDRHTGVAKLSPKQGDKPTPKNRKIKTEQIQICLSCERPDCKGNCKKMKGEKKI